MGQAHFGRTGTASPVAEYAGRAPGGDAVLDRPCSKGRTVSLTRMFGDPRSEFRGRARSRTLRRVG